MAIKPKDPERYKKWLAAGRPKMEAWKKMGAGAPPTRRVTPVKAAPKSRNEKWIAAGRPNAAEWKKMGSGIGTPKGHHGVESSKLLQSKLKAEPNTAKKSLLMDRYDKWLGADRPKMPVWTKQHNAGYPVGTGPPKVTPPVKKAAWKDTNIRPKTIVRHEGLKGDDVSDSDNSSKNVVLIRMAKNRLARK